MEEHLFKEMKWILIVLVESFESILSIQSPDSGVPDPQVSECFTFTKDSPYRVTGIGKFSNLLVSYDC